MDAAFAPGVSACLADGRLVVLSLALDRYLMLPPPSEEALLRLIDGGPRLPGDRTALERLLALGRVVPAPEGTRPALCSHAPPTRSFLDQSRTPPPRKEVAGAAYGVLRAMTALRLGTLAGAIGRVGAAAPAAHEGAGGSLEKAAAFAELRFSIRSLGRCLPLSLALARAAKRRDPSVRLVLGVACNPFAAHAWVQRGDLLLNDRIDSVAAFTPILAI